MRNRVPVVLQVDRMECGVACLSMVLQAHGIPATLGDCRKQLVAGEQGVNALSLAAAARAFGLGVKAYSAQSRAAVEQVPLPAIAHWGGTHFVVLERWSRRRGSVVVVDPARGRRRVSWAAFMERFSGTVLTFAPGTEPPTVIPAPRRSLLQRLLRWRTHPGTRE